jgi:hypothetical protein
MTTQFTKVLGAAPNVQYQGVTDNTDTLQQDALNRAVFTGKFKRGVLTVFTVTKDTVKARLGYDPTNPAYQAIVDVLDTGVPLVYVQRIRGFNVGGV